MTTAPALLDRSALTFTLNPDLWAWSQLNFLLSDSEQLRHRFCYMLTIFSNWGRIVFSINYLAVRAKQLSLYPSQNGRLWFGRLKTQTLSAHMLSRLFNIVVLQKKKKMFFRVWNITDHYWSSTTWYLIPVWAQFILGKNKLELTSLSFKKCQLF